MKMRLLMFPLALAAALSACSLTPPLVKPPLPVASKFPIELPGLAAPGVGRTAADLGWRAMYGDARLRQLIELALRNNRDLRVATLNVDAVQAQFNIQRATRFPSADLSGSASRERTSVATNGAGTMPSIVQDQYSIGLGMTAFEIDLFGRARAQSDAAFARYLASEQGRLAAHISLIGAVADAYCAELLANAQLELAKYTLTDWRQSLELTYRLKQAEQTSGLEVAQAEGQVAKAEADLEARHRAVARARNALILLIGTELPADLPPPSALDDQTVLMQLPAGLPSDLLLRRPDILQAEQALVSANADIGAARAAFFPRLSLTASLGYASPSLSGLFDAGQRTWRFAPQVVQPLFQGGRLKAELRLAEVRKSMAVAEYERTIQTAFREVADGLAGSATFGRQIHAQQRVVASAESRLAHAGERYRAGVEGRLELLDSQRQLYAARQLLLNLRREASGNAVALFKALGGGLLEDSDAFAHLPSRTEVR